MKPGPKKGSKQKKRRIGGDIARHIAFFARVKICSKTHCWNWKGMKTVAGYGSFSFLSEKRIYAHRFSYESFVESIPKGLVLDHLCRNPSCVNPDHLEPVTQKENCIRGVAPKILLDWLNSKSADERRLHAKRAGDASGAIKRAKTHCVKGHMLDEENTALTKLGHRFCRQCSRERESIRVVKRRLARQAARALAA